MTLLYIFIQVDFAKYRVYIVLDWYTSMVYIQHGHQSGISSGFKDVPNDVLCDWHDLIGSPLRVHYTRIKELFLLYASCSPLYSKKEHLYNNT